MRLDRPSPLPRTVEARAGNRPVKIVYLVPSTDSPENHLVLDGVFYESYTRWGGAYTLVIPVTTQGFLDPNYRDWLQFYDPDFVYTYVEIDQSFIRAIDDLCSPIALLVHKGQNNRSEQPNWRDFIPHWGHYVSPVSSITTIASPATQLPSFPPVERERTPIVVTQYDIGAEHPQRFLADNFGISFHIHQTTHAVPGLFNTLCLTPPNLSKHIHVGTAQCHTLSDLLDAMLAQNVITVARCAMLHSDGIPRIHHTSRSYALHLVVGDTVMDRIHFWNYRCGANAGTTAINALIASSAFFDDPAQVQRLGQYLNRTNFHGHGTGPCLVEIHSTTENENTLTTIRDRLAANTWNTVYVSKNPRASPVPQPTEIENSIHDAFTDSVTLRLADDTNNIVAKEPAHFSFIPPSLKGLTEGQWVVELSIERHNSLSRYSNVTDNWNLPRRRKIARAFTERLAKGTGLGHLALLPVPEGFPLTRRAAHRHYFCDVHLPEDADYFRHLALGIFHHSTDDLRVSVKHPAYVDLGISDKGQNLRGVISMLGHLPTAYEILTNKYWRSVLAEGNADSSRRFSFTMDKLKSFLPNGRPERQRLASILHLDSPRNVTQFLECSLLDTLEYLVQKEVFFKVAQWRCSFCGHTNSLSFDQMRIRNQCGICREEYFAPVDIEWNFELNEFVYRSLVKHSGLPVLWTLGYLQDLSFADSYWYLPEVDLYEKYGNPETKNEIDILCMIGGQFCAVEAKTSVSTFLKKEGACETFERVIGMLKPDVAMLSFLQYGESTDDASKLRAQLHATQTSIQARLPQGTELRILVAADITNFVEFPHTIGWHGPRSSAYLRSIAKPAK